MSLTIFGISKGKFQRFRKISLYWLGHLGAIYQRSGKHFLKTALIYLQKKLSFSYLVQKISFQVVAVENALFMSAFAIIDNLFTFQDVFPSGSRWDCRFGECPQKKSLPVVADEKGIFRIISRKKFKKIILPKLDRIFKSHLRPSWSEVKNSTSDQLGQK